MRSANAFIILFSGVLTLYSCDSSKTNENDVSQLKKEEAKSTTKKKVNIADIEEGIKANIDQQVEANGGYFYIKSDTGELKLKLVRVHTEYLSNLGPNYHFACVDLADISGDVYDVDFFMKGKPGEMQVTETTVHKLNGKPFYTWKQKKDKTWHRVAIENAENSLLGVVEGKDAFEFYYEVELPAIPNEATMWLPVASSDRFQNVEIISITAPSDRQILIEAENGNKIMLLHLNSENSNEIIRIAYKINRIEKGPYLDNSENKERYLKGNTLLPVGGRFTKIVNRVLLGKQNDNDLLKARALYDYIIDNMSYKKAGTYGTGDANYACDSKSGNCTEFHSFFISLSRTAGIPARFAIGASIPSDRNEGGINGYHCWAEFYTEGKWWPVDISEANKYTALATYYFGRHPANRIELNKGRDLIIEPGPQNGPIKFLAYPVLELDGNQVPVKTTFSFKRREG